MKITIKIDINSYDFVRINTDNISFEVQENYYSKAKDQKWRKHALKHHFNPNTDCYNNKIWDQYLRLCAEGLI